MSIRTCKQRHCSTQYHLSLGWPAFKRSNNILEGDECVFMYTTSEDKMCLAKITKKENVELVENCMKYADDNKDEDNDVELVDDGMDDKDVDEYAKLVDGMDDKDMEFDNNTDENEHENVELVDDGMNDKDLDEYANLVDGMDDKNVKEDAELVDDEDPFFRVT
ncbi:DNA-binding pseudobarrel domain-containing protein, partial [Tanacetum coccineum]